jgi:putative peptide zinc metalloprotease protein
VVWAPEESLVRAGTSGFVQRVEAEPGSLVVAGQVLVRCRDPLLLANVEVLRARVEELESRYDTALATDRVQAQIVERELIDVRGELRRAGERMAELEIKSPLAGLLVLPNASDLPDLFLRQGDLLAFVLDVERPTVRVVVPQSRVDLVRQHTRGVAVRPAEEIDRILPAAIKREVPEAAARLPSTVLGRFGGGEIAIDPTEQSGTKTFERTFQFDVEASEPLGRILLGSRVHVRFDHGYEPLGFQAYRSLRQLFLRRFNI